MYCILDKVSIPLCLRQEAKSMAISLEVNVILPLEQDVSALSASIELAQILRMGHNKAMVHKGLYLMVHVAV